MKRIYNINLVLISFILPFLVSCAGNKMKKIEMERDSLVTENKKNMQELNDLNSVISEINKSLNNIAINENLLLKDTNEDGVPLEKKQIVENIEMFGKIIEEQKTKISQLEDSLKNVNSKQWETIISSIKLQLEYKETEIIALKEEIAVKNRSIKELRHKLKASEHIANEANEQKRILEDVVKAQDAEINLCYVKIGTKKELQNAGLLTGGLLSKKKVNYSNIDKSSFEAVDIRMFTSVHLASSKPKILTAQPSSRSYHFEKNGDGSTTMFIDDPATFWSVSNYLIIQL